MLYFAYGSNLDPKQMRRRCPTYRFLSVARLPDHRLAFTRRSMRRRCGVADVLPSPGDEVWGVVYLILGWRDWRALDAAEGHVPDRAGNAYERAQHTVFSPDGGRSFHAQIYVANKMAAPPPPSPAYIGHMLRGADHWGLPRPYREWIASVPTLPR